MALGAIVFYGAGLLTYRFVERLRIASYSFAATGLAFIPLTGVAIYVLKIWTEGRYIWLLTSLVGTAAIVGACALMRNRVMAYLLISFIVSDSLAATKVAALPFVWYFVSLTAVATVLGLVLHFAPNAAPKGIREGLVDSSRIFVPATAIAIFFFTNDLSYTDAGIAFAVMSVHAILFTWLNGTADYYAQARIYPIASILSFILGLGITALKTRAMLNLFEDFQVIVEKMLGYVIIPLLPVHIVGVFANMTLAGQVAKILSVFGLVFVMVIILHWVTLALQYSVAGAVSRRNPIQMLKTMLPAYFTAIGTQSSAATIPVTVRSAKKAGISPRVVDFAIPLCATIHLSGSMITITSCSVAVLFMTGQHPDFGSLIPMILVLGVMMVAAPGVPGGGVMTAIGLLQSMLGFDASMIALMIALYLAQDSFGTATNVTGDATIAALTERISKAIGANPDKEIRDEDIEKAEAISA